jgi:hypothetical protein
MYSEKIRLDLEGQRGNRDAVGMLRIISERTLEKVEEICV